MNCQEFWNTVPDEGAAHPHIAECPACASRIGRQKELCAGLLAMAAQMDRVQAPEQVEERLLAAFRMQSGAAQRVPRPRWIPAFAWTAAMAAMIAAGVFVVRVHEPAGGRGAVGGAVELASMDGIAAAEDSGDDGFVPLPGAAQLGPSENLDLVRVELPRSAMMQVGIEVNPENASDRVQADVMVGSDGLARSVRFLEPMGSD